MYTLFYFLFVAFASLISAGTVPDYIHICKRNDPAVSKCIRNSVEALRPKLIAGIPEIGVPSLEPLSIKKIDIIRGGGGIRAELNNVLAHGAGDFKVTRLKLDIPKNTYHFGIKIPQLKLEGDYDVDARILGAPIQGKGRFNAEVTKIDGYGILRGEVVQNKGIRNMKFNAFDLALKIEDYDIKLHNLFNGDKVLSQAVGDLLKDNKKEMLENAIPFIQARVSESLLDAANKITENLDYDEAFPEK
ncbi:unnamed protein product [Brassicogethes aeneus]|uniref:Uncharacterized protein n=1 Tax=Brassicogethes aeneus TaxID=1431903 RepID=A0A9P0B967_BRAAE|nr:unnamed protein product [Brassicogethes aeneus]